MSIGNKVFSQTADKENPIIFGDVSTGVSFGRAGGLVIVLGMNYQVNRTLFTVRYVGTAKFRVAVIAPLVPCPLSI